LPNFIATYNLTTTPTVPAFTCACDTTTSVFVSSSVTINTVATPTCCPGNSTVNATTGVCACNTGYAYVANISLSLCVSSTCPTNSSLVNGKCMCNQYYTPVISYTSGSNSSTASLSCTCVSANLVNIVTVGTLSLCCPLNSTIVNGMCACATNFYIATPTSSVPNLN